MGVQAHRARTWRRPSSSRAARDPQWRHEARQWAASFRDFLSSGAWPAQVGHRSGAAQRYGALGLSHGLADIDRLHCLYELAPLAALVGLAVGRGLVRPSHLGLGAERMARP